MKKELRLFPAMNEALSTLPCGKVEGAWCVWLRKMTVCMENVILLSSPSQGAAKYALFRLEAPIGDPQAFRVVCADTEVKRQLEIAFTALLAEIVPPVGFAVPASPSAGKQE